MRIFYAEDFFNEIEENTKKHKTKMLAKYVAYGV